MDRPLKGIATDGAHSTRERMTRFRAVNLASGEELFSETIGNQTVNCGEFLGIIAAVRYILENNFAPQIIFSDSLTAITWYKNKTTASSRCCPALHKAEVFLRAMSARIDGIEVVHWNNRKWGETPADFGVQQIIQNE